MIKQIYLFFFLFIPSALLSQEGEWLTTEGELTEIMMHRSKTLKVSGTVIFNTENGTEVTTRVDLIRIPFYGCLNKVGDRISIKYNQANPALAHTPIGNFIFNYGMYILILLGIIFSIKPFLKKRKNDNPKASNVSS